MFPPLPTAADGTTPEEGAETAAGTDTAAPAAEAAAPEAALAEGAGGETAGRAEDEAEGAPDRTRD